MKSPIVVFLMSLFSSFAVVPVAIGANLVAITTTTLPNGTSSMAYSASINAAGGCHPYRWSTSGTLPPGVTATVSTTSPATLVGTPTAAGTYSFGVSVKGCGGHVSAETYTVVIQPAINHIVNLSWNATTSPDIAGYNVYRSANSAGPYSLVNASLIPFLFYSDSSVSNTTEYFYQATAVNSANQESPPSSPPLQVDVPYLRGPVPGSCVPGKSIL